MGAENLDINKTLEAWADIVLKIWLEKMLDLKIGLTYQLADSLEQHVISEANGDIARIEFAFKYYGKFVDMGVGNGVGIASDYVLTRKRRFTGEGVGTKRVAKPWYNKPLWSETSKLIEILAKKYALSGMITIVENVDDNAKYWEKTWKQGYVSPNVADGTFSDMANSY